MRHILDVVQGDLLEFDLVFELNDLLAVKQELAVARLIVIKTVALFIKGDMHTLDIGFMGYKTDIGIFELDLAVSNRFDLRA